MTEPFTSDARTKYALNDTVRILRTATGHWIVQERRLAPTGDKWWYADAPFWLALTPEDFAEIRAVYDALRNPAPPLDLESFL